jgi:endonuclease/exonuclease/phosphatase (EEP) superfamily protein YafD
MDLLGAAALSLAVACALAAAISLMGAVYEPFDILSHLTPLWLMGGAAACTLAALVGAGAAEALGAFAALSGLGLLAPEILARATRRLSPRGEDSLSLVQFNVWDHNQDAQASAAWVLQVDPDIVVLQEASGRGAAVLEALRAAYPYQSGAQSGRRSATFILSKQPPRAQGAVLGPRCDYRHLTAWATFGVGEAAFTVVGVHYWWPFRPDRLVPQIHALQALLTGFDRRSLILAGDFNLTPWSFALRRQDRRLGLARRTLALSSFPMRYLPFIASRRGVRFKVSWLPPLLPLDHVYAGEAWRTVSVSRGPPLGSDHAPVHVVLTRAASAAR